MELSETLQYLPLALGIWPKLGIVTGVSAVAAALITKIYGDRIRYEGLLERLEGHKCKICGEEIFGKIEEAIEHVKIPVDETELPKGLVYHHNSLLLGHFGYCVIQGSQGEIASNHSLKHDVKLYMDLEDKNGLEASELGLGVSYRALVNYLQQGKISLLDEQEFECFEKAHPDLSEKLGIDRLVRTTPELEKIVEGKNGN